VAGSAALGRLYGRGKKILANRLKFTGLKKLWKNIKQFFKSVDVTLLDVF